MRFVILIGSLIAFASQASASEHECNSAFKEADSAAAGYSLTAWTRDEIFNKAPNDMPRTIFELLYQGSGRSTDQAIVDADKSLKLLRIAYERDGSIASSMLEKIKDGTASISAVENTLLLQESLGLDEVKVKLAAMRIACGTSN